MSKKFWSGYFGHKWEMDARAMRMISWRRKL